MKTVYSEETNKLIRFYENEISKRQNELLNSLSDLLYFRINPHEISREIANDSLIIKLQAALTNIYATAVPTYIVDTRAI